MRNLLIVDDEPEVVEGLVSILGELEEVSLCTAYDANTALELIETQPIDIILADIHMPEMDGLELCEIIQQRKPEIRVIFLSGVRDFDIIYRSIRNPTVRYLTKMEPDYKIQETVLQVLEEMGEQNRQQRLQKLVSRTFPQSLLQVLTENPDAGDVVENVCSYIGGHLDGDLSLTALGTLAGFNPNYLSHIFKEQTSVSLPDYVMKLRMSTAQELVLGSSKKIHDIALLVGYDSAHSFIRAYQKMYGMSPSEHRKAH